MLKTIAAAAAAAALIGLAACGDSMEESGEQMDSAIEEATQGHENLGDGPLEQAGENIDQVTGAENDDPMDAVNDATDGDPQTQ